MTTEDTPPTHAVYLTYTIKEGPQPTSPHGTRADMITLAKLASLAEKTTFIVTDEARVETLTYHEGDLTNYNYEHRPKRTPATGTSPTEDLDQLPQDLDQPDEDLDQIFDTDDNFPAE